MMYRLYLVLSLYEQGIPVHTLPDGPLDSDEDELPRSSPPKERGRFKSRKSRRAKWATFLAGLRMLNYLRTAINILPTMSTKL